MYELVSDQEAQDLQKLVSAKSSFHEPALIGAFSMVVVFGGLALWSAISVLTSAVSAPGVVVVESSRKTIQHPEGGVVASILVNDGDEVAAGQVLVTLDATRLQTARQALRQLLATNLAQRARLEGERVGAADVTFPDSAPGFSLSEYPEIVGDQKIFFSVRRAAQLARLESLVNEKAQLSAVLRGLNQQLTALNVRIRLTLDELANARTLAESGSGTRFRVLQISRIVAELQGDLGSLSAKVMETEGKIFHADLDKKRVSTSFLESVETELQQINRENLDLAEKLQVVTDQVVRREIRSPVAGKVVNLAIHTIGGVIAPGLPILEVVPSSDALVIEAQVRPTDVEKLHPGLSVEIRLSGYEAKRLARLEGKVTVVSADRISDRARGTAYFEVRVVATEATARDLLGHELRAGMPVDVLFVTGEQTPLQYLVGPLVSFFSHSMRE